MALRAALETGGAPDRGKPFAVRGDDRDRELAPRHRQLHVHRVAAWATGGSAASRRLRDAIEARVLPALRGVDGGDAPAARDPGPGRGRLHERTLDGRRMGRHRPPGPCLGRSMVRRVRVAALRSDSGPRHALRRLHPCVRFRRRGARPGNGTVPPAGRRADRPHACKVRPGNSGRDVG